MLLEKFNSIDALKKNDDYKLIDFTDSSKMIYDFLTNSGFNIDQMEVIVPNPVIISTKPLKEILCNTATTTDPSIPVPITNFGKFSSFHQLAQLHIILSDQHVHYKEVLDYLNSKNKLHKDMPNIVSQLNLFKDEKGLLRVKRHELISLNIIPNLQPNPETEDDIDISWTTDDTINHIKDSYEKLKKLAQQATDRKSRYMPKTHSKLEIGDIVLIKEPFLKPSNYPMGKVEQVQINVNNEVTGATLLKEKTQETTEKETVNTEKIKTSRPQRKAAIQSKLKTALLYDSDSVRNTPKRFINDILMYRTFSSIIRNGGQMGEEHLSAINLLEFS
ncbi:hypothetical protein Avbf_18341 [Armadillidium vulgare]|nr:hypothetical protein Avbf_18341 [Armadillidium vulgare]